MPWNVMQYLKIIQDTDINGYSDFIPFHKMQNKDSVLVKSDDRGEDVRIYRLVHRYNENFGWEHGARFRCRRHIGEDGTRMMKVYRDDISRETWDRQKAALRVAKETVEYIRPGETMEVQAEGIGMTRMLKFIKRCIRNLPDKKIVVVRKEKEGKTVFEVSRLDPSAVPKGGIDGLPVRAYGGLIRSMKVNDMLTIRPARGCNQPVKRVQDIAFRHRHKTGSPFSLRVFTKGEEVLIFRVK